MFSHPASVGVIRLSDNPSSKAENLDDLDPPPTDSFEEDDDEVYNVKLLGWGTSRLCISFAESESLLNDMTDMAAKSEEGCFGLERGNRQSFYSSSGEGVNLGETRSKRRRDDGARRS